GWRVAPDATARCKSRSTGCARKRRSGRVLPWICGVKPKPKAVNKPSPHSIRHGLDKPGVFTTVSVFAFHIRQQATHIGLGMRRGFLTAEGGDKGGHKGFQPGHHLVEDVGR